MAYPTVSAPYGFKPVNLIGGQVYAGSTRNLPIAYNYGTAIYYGDYVTNRTYISYYFRYWYGNNYITYFFK